MSDRITSGLIIRKEPLERILGGSKTWELRGSPSNKVEKIALIESKQVGTAYMLGVRGPLTLKQLNSKLEEIGADHPFTALPYKQTYAYILSNAYELPEPLHYDHPRGAITWVKVDVAKFRNAEFYISL